MPTCHIDHITIVSPSLAAGDGLVYDLLGVHPEPGGQHPRMGTHNLLLRLGDALFLEVIAIDPDAPEPTRSRWFELDRLPPDAEPFLGCWVARTDDIDTSLTTASEDLGLSETITRGPFMWQISIPEDGSLPLDGCAPALIQWPHGIHPAVGLPDRGCKLVALDLRHPEPERLTALLSGLRFAESGPTLSVIEADSPGLTAQIDTPRGRRLIGTIRP